MESIFRITPKRETEAQLLARMKRGEKEAAQRLRDKKKPRDDKAGGGITDAIKIKRRFEESITTGDKIKRPGNRQLFDDLKNKFNVGGMANLSETYDNNSTLGLSSFKQTRLLRSVWWHVNYSRTNNYTNDDTTSCTKSRYQTN